LRSARLSPFLLDLGELLQFLIIILPGSSKNLLADDIKAQIIGLFCELFKNIVKKDNVFLCRLVFIPKVNPLAEAGPSKVAIKVLGVDA